MRNDQLPAPQFDACSVRSTDLGEPVAGTATTQSAWLVLEQPGPWGRQALVESDLDAELGAELDGRTAGTDVRVALIRRPGTGQDQAPPAHRWFAASTHPERMWLATGVVVHPTDLLRIDFPALDAGLRSAVSALKHEMVSEPVLLVCTNGKRDQCCATRGRQVAVAAAALDQAARGADALPVVWEVTHIGGHKFSPTAAVLPSGYLYGRLDAERATRVLGDARHGAVVLDGCRGRTTWGRAGQAAELAVRTEIGERAAGALTVTSERRTAPDPSPAWTVVVSHQDGRAFAVSVIGAMAALARPESCGKTASVPLVLTVGAVEKIH